MTEARRPVDKLWSNCNVLRDDGVSTVEYTDRLTYLLFRKMAHERERRPAVQAFAGRSPHLAGLAVAAGFTDQAHLTREWRAFSGLPPTRWLAAEFGYVQDTQAVSTALSAS